MHDYFGEDVAARYDETSAGEFDPAVIDPTVDFLHRPSPATVPRSSSGSGPVASRSRWRRAASR